MTHSEAERDTTSYKMGEHLSACGAKRNEVFAGTTYWAFETDDLDTAQMLKGFDKEEKFFNAWIEKESEGEQDPIIGHYTQEDEIDTAITEEKTKVCPTCGANSADSTRCENCAEELYNRKIRFKFDAIWQPAEIVHKCELCGLEIEHELIEGKKRNWCAYSSLRFCITCEDAEESHRAELFDSSQFSRIPVPPDRAPIDKAYKTPRKSVLEIQKEIALDGYLAAISHEKFQHVDPDAPTDWIYVRDVQKYHAPKRLTYIEPTQYDQKWVRIEERLAHLKQKMQQG